MSSLQTQKNKNPKTSQKLNIRWDVFIPGFVLFVIAAIVGLVNGDGLASAAKTFFNWSLDSFGWLYQIVLLVCFILVVIVTFSKLGDIKLGGKDAKPKFPFMTWFAMTLTGGVATGIVTWGVNEPLIYYGNVWGELDKTGIAPFTPEAARFAIARSLYNWTFLPYAIYALCGVFVAYLYYNRREKLSVTATLRPLFGDKITKGPISVLIDTLAMMALGLGITSGLSMCITLLSSGLGVYGIKTNMPLLVIIGVIIISMFTFSSYIGMDKGIKVLGSLNAWFYYGLLILLLVCGPVLFIARNSTAGLAMWLQNFWNWSLDPIDIGGEALVRSWTLFDWAIWIAYAPVTGIFLALIARGRTIREFMIVNWLLPSVFGFVWFAIWGNNALDMQISGKADLVAAIGASGAVAALWEFLKNLPFGLGTIVIPINLLVILISFVTAADATLTNIGSMCVKDVPIGTEPPARLKLLWGVVIGTIAIIMTAFASGEQGVEGVKQLGAAGGFVVLFIFILQLASFIKVFFRDKIEE